MSIRRTTKRGAWVVLATIAVSACAHVAPEPTELVEARAAFATASSGSAREVAPAELEQARVALASAVDAYQRDPLNPAVRDLAAVAQRRSLDAEAVADARVEERRHQDAQAARANAEAQRLQAANDQLARTRAQLAVERARAEANRAALEEERAAHAETAETAAAAIESLRQIAQVREEQRGLVITLSGRVLFPTAEAALLPGAQAKLRAVAALLQNMPNRSIEIEGHTDARGRESSNVTLSIERAEVVRGFLVANGVPPDRIRASGLGSSEPVATNATPEGRAENRRVEIVLEPAPASGAGGGPP
jgi:outer membrane protein OmpA-like peptidoglycan-associated protein